MVAAHLQELRSIYSAESEMSVLGAMLLQQTAAEDVIQILNASDFYNPAHREIFKAMQQLLMNAKPIDEVTLPQELIARGAYEKIGGWDYIAQVAETVPSAANAIFYANSVKDAAILRGLEDASRKIYQEVHDENGLNASEKLDKAERVLFDVAAKRAGKAFTHARALAKDFFVDVDTMIENGEPIMGVSSGFTDIDAMTAGFHPGDLTIVGARPSMGKTSLALEFAVAAASKGKGAAIFSLEMSEKQLTERIVSMLSGVSTKQMKRPSLSPGDYQRLSNACELIYSMPFWIDDTSDTNVMEMRGKCRRLIADGTLSLIVVDYLQLMRGVRKTENRVQEISDIARGLKAMAKDLGVPVVALSQLNRGVESREDKRPVLSDLRESGSIEAEADVVMLLYRDAYYKAKQSQDREAIEWSTVEEAEVIIAKHRSGPTGVVRLGFRPMSTKFSNLYQEGR